MERLAKAFTHAGDVQKRTEGVKVHQNVAERGIASIADWRSYGNQTLSPLEQTLLEVFIELGYHGATVRILAEKAGLTVPGLYYHFASKHDILVKLLHASIDELLHRSELALAEETVSLPDRLSLQIENAVLFMTYRNKQRQLTSRDVFNLSSRQLSSYLEKRGRFEKTFEDIIAAGMSERIFIQDDVKRVRQALLDMCAGVALWYDDNNELSPEAVASRYARYGLRLVQGS